MLVLMLGGVLCIEPSEKGMALVRTVRLRVPAGVARPGPAIGQALGPLGINMMEFCKVHSFCFLVFSFLKGG